MNLIEIILLSPEIKPIFIDTDDIQNTANLYLEILNYEQKPTYLGYAHIIYQKYLDKLSPYKIDIPEKYSNRIYGILWMEPDAADTDNLVIPSIFNNIKKYCYNILYNKVNQIFGNPILKDLILKKITRQIQNKNKRKSKFMFRKSIKLDWKNVSSWSVEQVCLWLNEINFPYLESVFENNVMDGLALLELNENDLFNLCIPYDDIISLLKNIKLLKKT